MGTHGAGLCVDATVCADPQGALTLARAALHLFLVFPDNHFPQRLLDSFCFGVNKTHTRALTVAVCFTSQFAHSLGVA